MTMLQEIERNQVRRINSRLADGSKVRLCSPRSRSFDELGRAYVVDSNTNVTHKNIDLGEWELKTNGGDATSMPA